MWTRAIALVTAATFMLQGCGSGIGAIDGAADSKDTLGAPSTAVPTDLNSLLAETSVELDGEPEFHLVKAADVELPEGVEQLEDVAQADPTLAEKAASYTRLNDGNPALYRCTVTQKFWVRNSNAAIHTKVASIMSAKGNVISSTQRDAIISTYFKDGLARHVGGPEAGYLNSKRVNSQTRYTGFLRGTLFEPARSTFESEIFFNTFDLSLCAPETSSRLSTGNGQLSPFWASLVAGASGAAIFGLMIVGILAVAPELLGGPGGGAWDIAACASAMATVAIYELAVKGGNAGWQTWVGAFAACVFATLPQYAFRGKWAATYAPWMLKGASGVRSGVISFWGWSRETIAKGFELIWQGMQWYDGMLPFPPRS
jgi:hypothetical protein